MNAYSDGLMMISNDVANLNSPGYKGNFLSFNSLFSRGGAFLGSGGGQTGYGVSMGSSFIDFSQGQLQQTSNPLDLAVQGNGFLTLLNGSNTFYARTGSFAVDKDGYISDAQGNHLAILNADDETVPFNINAFKTSDPSATTSITLSGNLADDGTTGTVSDIKVFDSRGTEHDWTVSFAKSDDGNPNDWTATVTDSDGTQVGTGTVSFLPDGSIDPSTSTLSCSETVTGANDLSVNLDLSAVTSLSGDNTVAASSVDGNAMGVLNGVGVTADGQVELSYSNGKTQNEGFVAMANFQDPQQLERLSGGLYRDPTGQPPRYFASGAGGMGTLESGQLEASNVNLSSEFGELILIERGFQACSQVVSISNEMIQTLFGMRGQG
jgi:flagellar hook protein FlgE